MSGDLPPTLAALPPDFLFGTATAAYQIEGAANEGGRGPSIWDTFSHTPGRTHRGDTGDIACDHYHRWESDLDLMAELAIPAYRFSLSWARLQPHGSGALNPAGVAFYRAILDGLRRRGITPLVTLYHWDLPQPLQDAGGWPSRDTTHRFADYARLCIGAFADLATDWITINEPACISFLSHALGVQAPGARDPAQAIRAAHHTLLAHGLALAHFRDAAPGARVGITNILSNVNPRTDAAADIAAAARLDIRLNRIFLEPCYHGQYPDDVVAEFAADGLNAGEADGALVQPGDLALIAARSDFVGVNHYHNFLASAPSGDGDGSPAGLTVEPVPPTPTSFGWSNTPGALRDLLVRVSRDFSPLPILVTENGASFNDYVDPEGGVNDVERIDYLRGYIDAVGQAVLDGADVRGYFAWSLMDNFEWAEGYDKRFGLVFVDYRTQERIPKASATWYRQLITAFQNLERTAP